MWRSWTVREEKDAIIDKEGGRGVNITLEARSIGTSFGRRGRDRFSKKRLLGGKRRWWGL